jgi:hypothetical protein
VKSIAEQRLTEKSGSTEASVLRAVLACEDQAFNAHLLVQAVTDQFNDGKAEAHQWTPQRMGRRLQWMGFAKTRGGGGGRTVILWDQELIARLCKAYGLNEGADTPGDTSQTSHPSQTSPEPGMQGTGASYQDDREREHRDDEEHQEHLGEHGASVPFEEPEAARGCHVSQPQGIYRLIPSLPRMR